MAPAAALREQINAQAPDDAAKIEVPVLLLVGSESPDEIKAFSIVGAICDYVHYEITNFIKPGLTENEVAAFGFERLYSREPGLMKVVVKP